MQRHGVQHEQLPQLLLALAAHAAHDLWARDGEDGNPSLIGNGSGERGLAAAGRAVEEDTPGGLHPEPGVDLRVPQRPDHDLLQGRRDLPSQSAGHKSGECAPCLPPCLFGRSTNEVNIRMGCRSHTSAKAETEKEADELGNWYVSVAN